MYTINVMYIGQIYQPTESNVININISNHFFAAYQELHFNSSAPQVRTLSKLCWLSLCVGLLLWILYHCCHSAPMPTKMLFSELLK